MVTARRSDRLHKLAATLLLFAIAVWQIFLLILAIWSILPKPIDWNATWDSLEKITSIIEHVVTVTALFVGGIWAYYRFIKGRVLIPRLELGVSGEIAKSFNTNYLWVSVELKNVGSSKVEITREGIGLDIFVERSRPAVKTEDARRYKVRSVDWEQLWPFDILVRHAWIEPGETIRDQILIELMTNEDLAYKVDLVIFASGTKWTATSIVGQGLKNTRGIVREALVPEEGSHG